MIFIDTKRFSPVIYENDLPFKEDYFHLKPKDITPEFLAKGDYDIDEEWWRKQEDRCKNGYVVKDAIMKGGDAYPDGIISFWYGNDCEIPMYNLVIKNRELFIPPRLYWYLNFWKLYGLAPGTTVKDYVTPKFIDIDYFFARRMEMMVEEAKNGFDQKARQIGFSEKMGGMNLGWNFTFVRASQNVIVAGTDADQQNTFNKTKNGLDNLKNTQFYKERKRGGNSSDFLEAEDFKSQLYGLTAKDNPQAVSRLSPYMAVLEEGGKWKKNQLIEAYNYIRPSQKAEGVKTGWCMIGGTGGKGDSGVEDMQDICYSPGSYEILSFPNVFEPEEENITGQVGHFTAKSFYYYIDQDGNSLVYKSKKKILEDRANMKPKAQYINMSQDALYLSHSFYIPTGGFFGPEIIGNLNARIAYVNNHREQQIGVPIRIDWIDPKNWSKGVKWTPDDNGLIMMYQEPKLDSTGKPVMNLYKGATDSYDQDISRTSNSKGSITIIKGFYNANESSNHWVARLLARPDNEGIEFGSIDKFSEETAKLCIMYGCQNLIEFSKILIFKWYQDNGLSYLLKERPSLVVSSWVKNSQVSNRYGIDANTKPHWLKLLRDYLSVSSNIDNMHDIEQMRAFAKFIYDPSGTKYNCDITISSSLNIVSLEEEKRYIVGEREKPGPTRMVYKTINGQLKQVAI